MDTEVLRDFTDPGFQEAFRAYFAEIGVNLKPDTDIWDEIAASAEKEGMVCHALRREGAIAAFILFQPDELKSRTGFFTRPVGFIRELWVRPAYRGQGLGRALVEQAAAELEKSGAAEIILTYDPDAFGFYQKLGFREDPAYTAKNGQGVVARAAASSTFHQMENDQ